MTRYARVDRGLVQEVIEVDGDIAGRYHPALVWVSCAEDVTPGWSYAEDVFAPPLPPVDPNIVPQVVTRRQGLLALLAAGKLDQVELAVKNAPRAVQIAWDAAGTFERTNPLIEALAPTLGLLPVDIDNLFIEAAKL